MELFKAMLGSSQFQFTILKLVLEREPFYYFQNLIIRKAVIRKIENV